jgi:ABC-type lipoprotein release transport system permease subunit
MSVREWTTDFAVGVRLAVGGGRTAMARLALSALGIAIATGVLLLAASVGTMSDHRQERSVADFPHDEPIDGVTPTYLFRSVTEYRGERVLVRYVYSESRDSPKPAALPALPKPGEMYVSPALGELLRSDDGALLRPRFPEKVVGTLDQKLVLRPGHLTAWVGADRTLADAVVAQEVYGFALDPPIGTTSSSMLTLILIGSVVLLLPIFTFITSASRIAGAERDRRLSALRLVGAGKWQVRRIASAEALVSAVIGLVLGGVLFAVGRLFVEGFRFFDEGVYTSDVVPDPVLAALLVLFIPALAVVAALFALRRTIIEPLGVVRQSKPVRRRAWWRFGFLAVGVLLLVTQFGVSDTSDTYALMVTAGATALLLGMLVLLPWLVERVANHLRGGPPSWMLAVRRLQLDSGTSARVVGGVAVVLAGMITLQTVLLSAERSLTLPGETAGDEQGTLEVTAEPAQSPDIQRRLAAADGVASTFTVLSGPIYEAGKKDTAFTVGVLDCATLKQMTGVTNCADGDVFRLSNAYQELPPPGTALEFREYLGNRRDFDPDEYEVTGDWTMPQNVRTVTPRDDTRLFGTFYATPGALDASLLDGTSTVEVVTAKDVTTDQLEGIRNAIAPYRWQIYFVNTFNMPQALSEEQQTYMAIRTSLYAGSIFTLLLAGVSMLVLALEHIRERRRPLAVLAASGVPRGVLARSLLWQVAMPIVLGAAMALATGIGLAALIIRLADAVMQVDWAGAALLCAGAIGLSLLVSAMTLPFLNRATRLTTLRTE